MSLNKLGPHNEMLCQEDQTKQGDAAARLSVVRNRVHLKIVCHLFLTEFRVAVVSLEVLTFLLPCLKCRYYKLNTKLS